MPRCSVIIPAYNVEGFVRESIRSALDQTYRDTEVVVVDDGSTDATPAVIDDFGHQIVCVRQPNRGLAAARNAALVCASGEYLALLDADDYWLPQRLERMVGYLDDNPGVGFVTSDAFLVYGHHPSADRYYGSFPRCRFRPDHQEYWLNQYNFVFVMTVCRRELFERHGGFDETLSTSEDWDLWLRFVAGGERVGLIPEALAAFRIRPGSLSVGRAQMLTDAVGVLERARSRAGERAVPGLDASLAAMRAGQALSQRRWADGMRCLVGATRDPTVALGRRVRAVAAGPLARWVWRRSMARRAAAMGTG